MPDGETSYKIHPGIEKVERMLLCADPSVEVQKYDIKNMTEEKVREVSRVWERAHVVYGLNKNNIYISPEKRRPRKFGGSEKSDAPWVSKDQVITMLPTHPARRTRKRCSHEALS